MQIVYDYIVTTVIFFLIFSFSMASLLNIVETPMRHVSEQQLTTRAETVLGNILGYMGDPSNWGEDISFRPEDLKAIGLSKNLKTDVIYDLDPSKLSRLLPIDTGASLHKDAIYKLLNLGRDYRFSLHMMPVLNISASPTRYYQNYATEFLVSVTTHERTPVGNVNLSVYIITAYIEKGANPVLIFNSTRATYNVTRWDGGARFNYTSFFKNILDHHLPGYIKFVGSLLVVIGDFFGMHTMFVYPTSPIESEVAQWMQGIIVGDYLIFRDPNPPTKIPFEKGKNMTVANEYTFNDVILTGMKNSSAGTSFPWLAYHNGTRFQVFELSYLEPDIYGACIIAFSKGEYYLVIFPRIHNVVDFGETTIPRGTRVVGIRRLVFVEDMAFFVDFYFWRTSE